MFLSPPEWFSERIKCYTIPQNKADRKITHTIGNVILSGKVFVLLIGVFKGFPIAMLQDSKHALKTFRNDLFTGV
jgi:hypothetical protein